MIRTVIYDMDGTLVDSEGAIALAGKEALVDWGIECQLPDFKPFTGQGDDKFIGGVANKYGIEYTPKMKERAYEIYMEKAAERVQVYPWSKRIIEFFADRGMKSAIASASDRVKVMYNIKCIGVSPDSFDAVITASEVTKQKPDPEVFNKALAAIGGDCKPDEALVFEDTLMGVKAAKAAGMKCIATTTSYPAPELYNVGADSVLPDIAAICEIFDIFKI
ncbi:MAG: HAD-IA family hydrolase [Clostridiales bacterium]|nr:HAD-IA family hydrolase [Clostridiales bacterium]